MKNKTNVVLLFVILITTVYSQGTDKISIQPKVYLGYTFSGLTSYIFTFDNYYQYVAKKKSLHTLYSKEFIGLSIGSNNLQPISTLYLDLALSYNIGRATTERVNSIVGNAEFEIKSQSIMFWMKLKSSGKLSLNVQFGIGAGIYTYNERYYEKERIVFVDGDITIKENTLAYGFGGGMEVLIIDRIIVGIVIISEINKEGPYFRTEEGRELIMNSKTGRVYTGLTIGYNIN